MKFLKKHLQPVLFTVGGMTAGYLYYHYFGCTTGCAITSSPLKSMAYMGVIGWLLSSIFRKEDCSCNI